LSTSPTKTTTTVKTAAIRVGRVLLWLVYIWVAIVLVLLFLRFVLELFGANPTAGFVDWVYRSTQRAMAPFRGIFESVTLSDKSTLDISVLFAMIVYGFVALGLHVAIEWITGLLETEQRRQRHEEAVAASAAAHGPGQVVQLAGPTGVAARAVLTPQTWGTSIELTAAGLDPAQTYSVWLEGRDGTRTAMATLQPGPNGVAQLSLNTPVSLADSSRFGLTLLPRPGGVASDVVATQLG
jgi:uncharacterized protein YggT (Ycf19 family)